MKKLALIALFAAAPAFAGDLYVVGSVGQAELDVNKADFDSEAVNDMGATNLSSSLDDSDTAFKLLAGYQYNRYLAVEAGYVDFGKATYSGSADQGSVSAQVEASGWTVAAVGTLPINDAFSVFGKIGTIYAKVKASGDTTFAGFTGDSVKTSDWKPTWGVGATYNINKQFGVRAEYEQFKDLGDNDQTGEADVNLLSVGVVYKF